MKFIDKASDLGQEIAASKEYIKVLEAEKRYKEDTHGRELIKEFQEKQKILSSLAGYGDAAGLKKIRKELAELFEEIDKNQAIGELNKALNEFLMLKRSIYNRIEAYINIDEEIFSLNNSYGCNKGCGGCKKNTG